MIVNSDIIYKGNIHCHSTNSDGQLSPEKVCEFYKNLNYDFISLTDHFKSEYNFTISDTSNFSDDKFTTITGAELHAGKNSNGDEWHILSVGIPKDFTSPTEDESGPEIATRALKAGAFVAIAHPEWSGLNLNDALSMPLGIHAIEAFNGVCKTFGRENGSYLIDQVMASGRMIGAIATDDAHYYEKDANAGWVMVQAASNSHNDILDALKSGNYYGSTGPEIIRSEIVSEYFHVETSNVDYIGLVGRGARFEKISGENLKEAKLPLAKFHNSWARLILRTNEGKQAWGHPFKVYL